MGTLARLLALRRPGRRHTLRARASVLTRARGVHGLGETSSKRSTAHRGRRDRRLTRRWAAERGIRRRDTAGGVVQRRGGEPGAGCQRTRGRSTMQHKDVAITWSEVVTALAVLGVIVFLLLH
jgi:hypothetical protein